MYSPVILETNTQNLAHIDLFSKLMSNRIIFIDTEINSTMSSVIQAQLLYLSSISKEQITIYINTNGGSVYDGLGIYDTMQFVKKRCSIKTVCIGMAASMGAILLSGGTKGKRYGLKHSRTMIHQPMGGAVGQVTDIKITYEEIEKLQKELYEILADNTGKSLEVITKDCDRDFWMTAEEAIDYGIIDNVLS